MENVNGVFSSYIYNNNTRRLQNLITTATNGSLHNISYTYDPVGNITNITNTATGADGLGGSFSYNYSYDDLYRLDTSDGSGSIDAAYTLAMAYSPSGNILTKAVQVNKELLGNASFEQYYNEYSYGGAHTLGMVNDALGNIPALHYNFDANGNMITQQRYNDNSGIDERYLCWDEENRLSATRDNNYVTANIYDASGNRAWKLAGEMNWMWQNGSGWQGYGDLNLRTWYQSELMTITDVGFTKHYFIAGQKIASKLGEGFLSSDGLPALEGEPLVPIFSEYSELVRAQTERLRRDFECFGLNYDNFSAGETYFEMLRAAEQTEIGEEGNIYFYHSDHLGSSSFLTDGSGYATQHLQYMPFGEDLVHQQNTAAYYTPYTFSGKERDMETGLSYFGARYYDAGLSIWLSVDPLADKYPSLSPYAYVANNPIMYIDPDGRDIVLPKGTSTKDTYTILGNLQKLTNDKLVYSTQKDGSIRIKIASLGEGNKPAGTRLIRTLNSSDKVTTIEIGTGGNSARPDSRTSTGKTDWTKSMNGTGDNVTVNFDPSSNPSIKTIDPKTGNVSGRSRPNQVGLAHELIHADHITSGDVDFTSTNHTYQTAGGNVTQKKPNEELRTVGLQGVKSGDITENQIRKEQKQNPRGAY